MRANIVHSGRKRQEKRMPGCFQPPCRAKSRSGRRGEAAGHTGRMFARDKERGKGECGSTKALFRPGAAACAGGKEKMPCRPRGCIDCFDTADGLARSQRGIVCQMKRWLLSASSQKVRCCPDRSGRAEVFADLITASPPCGASRTDREAEKNNRTARCRCKVKKRQIFARCPALVLPFLHDEQ